MTVVCGRGGLVACAAVEAEGGLEILETGVAVYPKTGFAGTATAFLFCTEEEHTGDPAVMIGKIYPEHARGLGVMAGWVFCDDWAVCPECRERILDGD